MTLIVSFCNVTRWGDAPRDRTVLAAFAPDGLIAHRLLKAQLPDGSLGITGVCARHNELVCVVQSEDSNKLCFIDHSLRISRVAATSKLIRGHSILAHRDELYAVSTGTDEIVKLTAQLSETPCFSLGTNANTAHLNSICVTSEGRFCATAFGPESSPENQGRLGGGYLFELPNGSRIAGNLSHPHSATAWRDRILFCQSGAQLISDDRGCSVKVPTGYPRGLAATDDRLYIGISRFRDISMSTSDRTAGGADSSGPSARILVYSWKNSDIRTAAYLGSINLNGVASEIYDILCI